MVPPALDCTDLIVAAEPVKSVPVEPGCCVDVLRGKCGTTAAVDQHKGPPIHLRMDVLNFSENYPRYSSLVIVLHAKQCKVVASLGPEISVVAAA